MKKIQQEFGVSEYLARQSNKLVEERSILGPLRGLSLPSETACTFYEYDNISRIMPRIIVTSENSHATLQPFVAYYLDLGEVRHLSYVVISNCVHHDTVAVHLFSKSFRKIWLHPKNFLMVHHNTKTGKTSWNYFTTKIILESKLNGIFQPLHIERGHVIVWAERLAARGSLLSPANDTTPIVQSGIYELFTVGIVATKIMQENREVWGDTFKSHRRSLV